MLRVVFNLFFFFFFVNGDVAVFPLAILNFAPFDKRLIEIIFIFRRESLDGRREISADVLGT